MFNWLKRLFTLDASEATCHVCGSIEQRADMKPIEDLGVTYLLCRRCSPASTHG